MFSFDKLRSASAPFTNDQKVINRLHAMLPNGMPCSFQVWHWCLPSGQQFSFLCPNGTVFNQAVRVCDWWFNVDCPHSPDLYSINNDLYRDKDGNLI